MFANVCLMYHWTLDYVLDNLTFKQVVFFSRQAALFMNPDMDDKPDREKLHKVYGRGRRISR